MASGKEYWSSIMSALAEIQSLTENDPDILEHFVTELREIDVLVDDLGGYIEERVEEQNGRTD